MSNLPSMTSEKVIKLLLENGYELDHQTGSHRIYYNKTMKRRVVVPYHKRDLPKGTLVSILKEAGLWYGK